MAIDDKHYRARITKRADFAPDLWMIRIDPGAEFAFAPGQYATLGVEKDTRRLERPYSIVSSPYEKEIEFFFELVPHGQTTPPLYDLQPGDEVLMRKIPKGRFTLDISQPATQEPPDALDRHRRGAICQLRPDAVHRLEERRLRRRSQPVSAEWGEPSLGIRLSRGAGTIFDGGPVVHVCADHEPPLGGCELEGRSRPRG